MPSTHEPEKAVPEEVDRQTLRRKQGGALPEDATASPDDPVEEEVKKPAMPMP